jgi:hypothetical protein
VRVTIQFPSGPHERYAAPVSVGSEVTLNRRDGSPLGTAVVVESSVAESGDLSVTVEADDELGAAFFLVGSLEPEVKA